MNNIYVQYGCGLSAPKEWINFDASPTLRIQKIPLLGTLLKSKLNAAFPKNVKYGDIIKGLPGIQENSCNGVYCSHILEHLALEDFRISIQNTYKILKPGGIFRCVVPDLEIAAKNYITGLSENKADASILFLNSTILGYSKRNKGLKSILTQAWGNSNHLFMWDRLSLKAELEKVGFKNVRQCEFNDNKDEMFKLVESADRFEYSVAMEAIK